MTRKSLRAPASERRQQTIQNKRSWKVTDSRQKPLKLTVAKISKRVCTAQFACFFGSYSVSPVGWHHPPTSGSYVACRGSSPRSDVPERYLHTAPVRWNPMSLASYARTHRPGAGRETCILNWVCVWPTMGGWMGVGGRLWGQTALAHTRPTIHPFLCAKLGEWAWVGANPIPSHAPTPKAVTSASNYGVVSPGLWLRGLNLLHSLTPSFTTPISVVRERAPTDPPATSD